MSHSQGLSELLLLLSTCLIEAGASATWFDCDAIIPVVLAFVLGVPRPKVPVDDLLVDKVLSGPFVPLLAVVLGCVDAVVSASEVFSVEEPLLPPPKMSMTLFVTRRAGFAGGGFAFLPAAAAVVTSGLRVLDVGVLNWNLSSGPGAAAGGGNGSLFFSAGEANWNDNGDSFNCVNDFVAGGGFFFFALGASGLGVDVLAGIPKLNEGSGFVVAGMSGMSGTAGISFSSAWTSGLE
jgi:hypothetical protein